MSNEWKHANPDQSKILVKHGIVIDTFWYWLNGDLLTLQEVQRQDCNANRIPAPDVAELGRVLPGVIKRGGDIFFSDFNKADDGYQCDYDLHEDGNCVGTMDIDGPFETEAQARAAAVIYLIENKRATWDQEKQMLIAV